MTELKTWWRVEKGSLWENFGILIKPWTLQFSSQSQALKPNSKVGNDTMFLLRFPVLETGGYIVNEL